MVIVKRRFGIALIGIILLFSGVAYAHTDVVMRDVDVVWALVWDDYVDPFFNGVSWQRLPDEYGPRIAAAETEADAYRELAAMIDELNDPLTSLLPPFDTLTMPEVEYAGVGVAIGSAASLNALADGIEFDADEIAVLEVFEGAPAEEAGVLVGDIILAVDDWEVNGSGTEEISNRVRGPVGTRVELRLRAPTGEERVVGIVRSRVDLSPQATVEKRYGAGRTIGYLRLDHFGPSLLNAARERLVDLGEIDVLVVDLRGLWLGDAGNAVPLANLVAWFTDRADLGHFESRRERFTLQRAGDVERIYDGPLVVLVDGGTGGFAEILALVLAESRRATVVGMPTQGGFSLSRAMLLPSGWGLNLSVARYESAKGATLHGEGLTPEVLLEPVQLDQLRTLRDPWWNQLIDWLANADV